MNTMELRERLFDTVLKAAVEEDFQRRLDETPSEKELARKYEPSDEFKQKIQRIMKQGYHRMFLRKARRLAKRAAVIIAIIVPVSLGSLLSVEASRNAICNAVMEWKADYVDIYFQTEQSPQDGSESGLDKPEYLPNGFFESRTIKIGSTQRIEYQNERGETIVFDQTSVLEEGKTMVDSEHTIYKEIKINGQKASLFTAKTPRDKTYIFWQSGKTSFKLYSTIEPEELEKIARSIQ